MKIFVQIVAAAVLCSSALAQGTIFFSTRVVGQVDAPIWVGMTGIGALGTVNAQLFLVTGSGAGATYTALTPATTFFTGNTPANRYVIPPDSNVTVPGVGAGQQATIVLRAFMGSTYDSSAIRGETAPITITLGGQPPTGAPLQPAVLSGLQGFSIPEPSTTALCFLGAAALLLRRRK